MTAIRGIAAEWGTIRRTGAPLHFLVVSDDNADRTPDEFENSLADGEPPIDVFTFHAVAATLDKAPACDADAEPINPCCEFAAKAGTVYETLVAETDGVFCDLRLQRFDDAFDALSGDIFQKRCTEDDII